MSCHRVRSRLQAVALATTAFATAGLALAGAADAVASAGVVTGRVTGSDGKPLAHVTVALVHPGVTGGQSADLSTTTDAAGRYTLTGDLTSSGEYLQFSATGATGGTSATGYADRCLGSTTPWCWVDGGTEVRVADGATRTVDAVLTPAGVLSGRAVDAAGRGLGGLPVTLWATYADFAPDALVVPVVTATTDANGNYRTAASPWRYSVCFGDATATTPATPGRFGYAGVCIPNGTNGGRVAVTASRTTVRNATLEQGAALGGTVVDTAGRPIAGATVSVSPDVGGASFPQTATSRADGAFTVTGLLARDGQDWCVSKPGYVEQCSPDSIRVTAGRITSIGQVVLRSAS